MPQLRVRGQAPGQLRTLHSSLLQCCVVQVRQIFSHIKESHKDALTRDDKEATDFTLTCLLQEGFQEREVGLSTRYLHTLSTRQVGTWITVIWNHKNGQTFFPMFEKRAGAWFAWIFMLTNPEEAGKHISYFSVVGVNGVQVYSR